MGDGSTLHLRTDRAGIGNDLFFLLLAADKLVTAGYTAHSGMACIDAFRCGKSMAHQLLIRRERGHIKARYLPDGTAPEPQVKIVVDGILADDQIANVQLRAQRAGNAGIDDVAHTVTTDQDLSAHGSIDFADTTLYHHYGQPLQVAFTKFHARAGGDGHVLHIFLQRLDLHRHSANDSKLHSFSLLIPDR